jgi:hypothetical protein
LPVKGPVRIDNCLALELIGFGYPSIHTAIFILRRLNKKLGVLNEVFILDWRSESKGIEILATRRFSIRTMSQILIIMITRYNQKL